MMSGIGSLHWRNVQTITFEPGAVELARLGRNQLGHLRQKSVKGYDETGWFRVGIQLYDLVKSPSVPVAGLAPEDLTGKGRVLVVGTWDVIPPVDDRQLRDDVQFLVNVIRWLNTERS